MAYQTLYRTFRPQTFSEIVGQEAIVRALKNQVQTKRIAHAYLFCGSRGTGKTSAARIMAMAINCQNPREGDPCLVCDNCKGLKSETTLDVFEMDAASNSRVEEIREMLSRTDYPPQFVPFKVYIIDEVHMLSNAAFNALLKTLEEPPPYMVFILATTEPQKLPATILSRCQRYDFGRIPENEIVRKLKVALGSDITADEEALRLIAASAQGAMRDAWSLMDMCLGSSSHLSEEGVRQALGAVSQDFLFEFLDSLLDFDTGGALSLIDQLMRDGRDVSVFLREFNAHIRQVLAVLWTGRGSRDLSREQLERYIQQGKRSDSQLFLFFLEVCLKCEQDARWSTSPRAVAELLVLRCANPSTTPVSLPAPTPKNTRQPAPVQTKPELAEAPQKTEKIEENQPAKNIWSPPEADSPPQAIQRPQVVSTMEAALDPAETPSQPLAKSPKDAWNNLLKRLQKEHPSLAANVNLGKYGGYENQVFTLLLGGNDKFWIDALNKEDRSAPIVAILSEEMGQKVRFEAKNKDGQAQKSHQDEVNEQVDELARVFGRDKIVLKND